MGVFVLLIILLFFKNKKYLTDIVKLLQGAHDAWSGWLCVLLVGIAAGCVAGVVDIGVSWMSDLKHGICPNAFWYNREQCCWPSKQSVFEEGNCTAVSESKKLESNFRIHFY